MEAVLIAVGSELLRPGRPEAHSAALTLFLEAAGLEVVGRRVVPDRVEAIAGAVAEARAQGGLILVTGGIGPTRDDRTREGVARALGRPLRVDRVAERDVRAWCRRIRAPYSSDRARQSLIPTGATALSNRTGSAPGIWYADARGMVAVLPGVTGELKAMLPTLLPRLRRRAGEEIASATLRVAGPGESTVDARVASLSKRFPRTEVTTLASPGEVVIQLRCRGKAAGREVSRCRAAMARRLGRDLVSECGKTLEEEVLSLLRQRRLRMAVAESCTAGMVAARLTSVPGSSRSFLGGAVCYNDRAKTRILSVPTKILERDGAVSRRATLAMAKGVIDLTGAEVAVAITGIAGPGGAAPGKPVGLVHWAVGTQGGLRAWRRRLTGDREKIRSHAATIALDLVRRALLARGRIARTLRD